MQKVVSPIGEVPSDQATEATWRVDLAGTTVGMLSNGKANSAELLAAIEKRLRARYDLGAVVRANKSLEAEGPGRPASPAILERMSSGVVAVLAASGD